MGLDTPLYVALGKSFPLSEPQSEPCCAGQSTEHKGKTLVRAKSSEAAQRQQGEVAIPLGSEAKRGGRKDSLLGIWVGARGPAPGAPAPPFWEALGLGEA